MKLASKIYQVRLNDRELDILELLRDGEEHEINSWYGIENMFSKFDMLGILLAQDDGKKYMLVRDNKQVDREHRGMKVRKEYP